MAWAKGSEMRSRVGAMRAHPDRHRRVKLGATPSRQTVPRSSTCSRLLTGTRAAQHTRSTYVHFRKLQPSQRNRTIEMMHGLWLASEPPGPEDGQGGLQVSRRKCVVTALESLCDS